VLCCRYVNTTAVKSKISFIDGDKGILRYRGYPIEQLAERSNFLEVRHPLAFMSKYVATLLSWHMCLHLLKHCVTCNRGLWPLRIWFCCLKDSVCCIQVAYLLLYGDLPSAKELARFEEAVGRHSAVPAVVEDAINALPHDAHFMGTILVGINALSTCHPEQNPALAGQDVYKSKEIQDKQIVRLIGTCKCMHI